MSSAENKNSLLQVALELSQAISMFRDINTRANFISFNAAIEGARMRTQAPSFAIVAHQVQTQAQKNLELIEKLESLVSKIRTVSLRATAARYYELAEDLIDKVDRNLFERNCDVQAWATFESIRSCAEKGTELNPQEALAAMEQTKEATDLLSKLVSTYQVYRDVVLVNRNGVVIASALRPELVGQVVKGEEWFEETLSGKVHVRDMGFCPLVKGFSVSYSAPVNNSQGTPCGVISTRFNWDYAQEMIDSGGYDKNIRAYYVNSQAVVMGSTQSLGILQDAMYWLESGRATAQGYCGFGLEKDRNGSPLAIGYSRTKGYNAYKGLNWSAIVMATIAVSSDSAHVDNVLKRGSAVVAPTEIDAKEVSLIESEKANLALRETMTEVESLVRLINLNNRETKFLAINASIQSGIAGEDGEGFAIIAGEIAKLAKLSLEFVARVNILAEDLASVVAQTVHIRLVDAATDAIDKVDRNLFERYCDVQAWTTFAQFREVIANASQENRSQANALLARLHQIYEVYHEIILLDVNGNIVSSAKDHSLVGQCQKDRGWFQEALGGKVNFTDVYHSRTVSAPTVTFSAPVTNDKGEIIGVLSTRFHCNFLNDILRAVIVDSQSQVFLTNTEGLVIGTSDGSSVLSASFKNLSQEIRQKKDEKSGLILAKEEDKEKADHSYAIGKGYNNYPGRKWCLVIRRPLNPAVEARIKKAA